MLVEELFEDIGGSLKNTMASFCGSADIAEDAAQQAFLKAVMNRAMLEMMPPGAMKSWVYAVARNASIDMMRKQKRLVFYDDGTDFVDDKGDFTEGSLVRELIEALPEGLKTVICLKYYSGFNSSEIGAALGIPAATVRGQLRTAINTLRQNLNIKEKQ